MQLKVISGNSSTFSTLIANFGIERLKMGINGSGNCIIKFICPYIARLPAFTIIVGIIFDRLIGNKKITNYYSFNIKSVKNFTKYILILLLTFFITSIGFDLKSQSLAKENSNVDGILQHGNNFSDHFHNTPLNFHIRLDIDRLKKLQPEERETEAFYFFPDTILVYSVGNNPIRYNYFYSQKGERLITFIKEFKNNDWTNKSFENCTYDEFGNLLTSTWQKWENGGWVNTIKSIYTYTTNRKVLTYIGQQWNGSSWVNQNKTTNSYDVSGNAVAVLMETWLSGNWTNVSYELYTYDSSNNRLTGSRQVWINGGWLNDQQYTWTYNANNSMLTSIIENWSNGEWAFFYKETYVYNTSNQAIQITGQLWTGSVWAFSEKFTYTYNSLGFVTMAVGELWENNQWVFYERGQFGHNNFGGIQSSLRELWSANNWMNTNLTNYNYDANGNALICDLYFWDGNVWIQNQDGVMRLYYSYSINTKDVTGYKALASYTSIQVGIPDSEMENKQTLTLSPNPANDKVILHFELLNDVETEINIFNNAGVKVREVLKQKMNKGINNITVAVNDLPSGMYMVRLTAGNQTKHVKLLITK